MQAAKGTETSADRIAIRTSDDITVGFYDSADEAAEAMRVYLSRHPYNEYGWRIVPAEAE